MIKGRHSGIITKADILSNLPFISVTQVIGEDFKVTQVETDIAMRMLLVISEMMQVLSSM